MYGSILGIDRDSGVIRVLGEIDYERDPLIELVIIAADAGDHRRTAQARVIVHVSDHNDELPTVSIDVPSTSGVGHVTEGEGRPTLLFPSIIPKTNNLYMHPKIAISSVLLLREYDL